MFVAFSEQQGATLVELGVAPPVDVDALRVEALRVALSYLEGPVVIDVVETQDRLVVARADLRVQLLLTLPVPGERRVEIHLAHQARRTTADAVTGDRLSVATAVIEGLGRLGLPVPFETVAAHALPPDLGSGALVVLRDRVTGQTRRGIAGGRSLEDSTARAVLNGLNRYLQATQVDRQTRA
jgi:hypothetical protein